jgi:hypothetical protein
MRSESFSAAIANHGACAARQHVWRVRPSAGDRLGQGGIGPWAAEWKPVAGLTSGSQAVAELPVRGRGERTAYQRWQVGDDTGEFADVGLGQRLVGIAQRELRVGVDVNDDAIRSGGNRGPGQRDDQVTASGSVRWVNDDRQVRQPLRDQNRADVKGVAGRGLEGTDATWKKFWSAGQRWSALARAPSTGPGWRWPRG